MSQHQSQQSSSSSDTSSGVAKYLLKLWIQKRLDQIRSNQTEETQEPEPESGQCPETYSQETNSAMLCSLWREYQVSMSQPHLNKSLCYGMKELSLSEIFKQLQQNHGLNAAVSAEVNYISCSLDAPDSKVCR